MTSSRDRFQPWPMACLHVLVVTLLLAAVGPATGMPSLLAVGLVGVALAALCSAVPPVVAVGLATGSGVLLEIVYHAEAAEPAALDSAARVLLLAAVAFGMAAMRKPAAMLRARQNPPGGR